MADTKIYIEKLEHFKKLLLDEASPPDMYRNAYSRLIEKYIIVKLDGLENFSEQDFKKYIENDTAPFQIKALFSISPEKIDSITKKDIERFNAYSRWAIYFFNPIQDYKFGNGPLDYFSSDFQEDFKKNGIKTINKYIKEKPIAGVNWSSSMSLKADISENCIHHSIYNDPSIQKIRSQIISTFPNSENDTLERLRIYFDNSKAYLDEYWKKCDELSHKVRKNVFKLFKDFQYAKSVNVVSKIEYNKQSKILIIPEINEPFSGIGYNTYLVIDFLYKNRNTNTTGYGIKEFRRLNLTCSPKKLQQIIRQDSEIKLFKRITSKVGNKYIYKNIEST